MAINLFPVIGNDGGGNTPSLGSSSDTSSKKKKKKDEEKEPSTIKHEESGAFDGIDYGDFGE